MSDEKRKLNKHSTGTVPKVKYTFKYRNNTGQPHHSYVERDNLRNLPNNLNSEWLPRRPESNFHRNAQHSNFESMETLDESHHNGVYANGTASSQTSSSNSRRNSCSTVPKCDNVTKYPNKKQIEDKLNQIREYLHITTSLMSGMKNGDEQNPDEQEKENLSSMIEALEDSEKKLSSLLLAIEFDKNSECVSDNSADRRNGYDDQINREIPRDSQSMTLQHLKQKGDSRMRDARLLQERLAQGNSMNTNRMENNLHEYDLAIAELEETTKRLKDTSKSDVNSYHQEEDESRLISEEIEELQNQIQVMHSANEDRTKLIQLLDKRDAELRCQHLELQNKLTELHTKKNQVDHLVSALQNTPKQEDDMSTHMRKIVSMKELLAKLKDMLEMVENTETIMQNGTQEEQAAACELLNKAEILLNKDVEKGNSNYQILPMDNHSSSYENRAGGTSSVNLDSGRGKLTNKKAEDGGRAESNNNSKLGDKLVLQAELKAKKRELEEIMGKHKASSSNLNHDVGTDNKSEFSCSNSLFDNVSGVWAPLLPSQHNQPGSSERYSSDGSEDGNEYTEIAATSSQNRAVLPPQLGKYHSERNNSAEFLPQQAPSSSYERANQPYFMRSPEVGRITTESAASNSAAGFSRGSSVSNLGHVSKQNVQKQLELIRSVCDSMLPHHQTSGHHNNNNLHLRNNLTPSPAYSELPQFSSPIPHPSNTLNLINTAQPPVTLSHENGWFPGPQQPSTNHQPFGDAANYQNWLTTNTLQTQAFMLNSLNQCCQMLWLQQRELAGLRATVTALQQERLSSPHYNNNENQLSSPLNVAQNQSEASIVNQAISMNHCGRRENTAAAKPNINNVTVPHPNLNQLDNASPSSGVEPMFVDNHANVRLLDGALNNVGNLATVQQGENDNLNQMQGHVWNGQALNNQVAPGNRANNYWDNFRSYSRQNLFSTKNNDVIQNLPLIDRFNVNPPRTAPFELHSLPKSNSDHVTAISQENIPQRSCVKPSRRYTNTNIAVVPPDVLNINQNVKNDDHTLPPIQNNETRSGNGSNSSSPNRSVYSNNFSRTPRRHSNVAAAPPLENSQNPRRRIMSNESVNVENSGSKSKLFEELRENVYKEVASLISANEARPHFLIQLFRDLQLVSSDPLRLKTLQSIQVLISQSLRNSHGPNLQETSPNQEIPSSTNEFSMQSTVWSPIPPNSIPRNATILEGLISKKSDTAQTQHCFHEIIQFMNDNEHLTLNQHLLATLKQKMLDAKSFKKLVKDTIFQKHFSNMLDEVLSLYVDKTLCAVKTPLLQSVRDLLDRELTFMNLIHRGVSEHHQRSNELATTPSTTLAPIVAQNPLELRFQPALVEQGNEAAAVAGSCQIENDDLAEADQSHLENEDTEEEGAVGGLIDSAQNPDVVESSTDKDEELTAAIEALVASTEAESQYQLGLDQVPTRLPTKSKSRSNTPNKDRTVKRDVDHPDPPN